MASREIEIDAAVRFRRRRGLHRKPPWHCAKPRRGEPDCRSSDNGAPDNNRARLRGSGSAALVAGFFRHPDAAVIAQRFAHQREFGLIIAGNRDAGRMNLRETGIGEGRAALIGAPDGGGVGAFGVGRKIEDVAVAAGSKHHGVGRIGLDLAGNQVAGDDAAGFAVDHDQVEHFGARKHFHFSRHAPAARAPGMRPAEAAGPSARERRRCAKPARRRRNDLPACRHIRARTERLARHIDR